MRKICRRILICGCIAALGWSIMLLQDRQTLDTQLIRLHVVAHSDSVQDQQRKLRVRDAVLEAIGEDLHRITQVDQAKAYLEENLPKIQAAANLALKQAGDEHSAAVTLCREAFATRKYDTFTLPAGVYESLRIVIGEGQGKNWWCVAFPELCIPVAGESFRDTAVGAGFSGGLADSLAEGPCEIRFYLLDLLGQVENFFYEG